MSMSSRPGVSYSSKVDIASVMERNNSDSTERRDEAPRRRSYAPDKGYGGHFGAPGWLVGSALGSANEAQESARVELPSYRAEIA